MRDSEYNAKFVTSARSGGLVALVELLSVGAVGVSRFRLFAVVAGIVVVLFAVSAGSAFALVPSSFGEAGTGAGQFRGGNGIAIEQSSGDVYIDDALNERVDRFGAEGEFKLAFGWGVANGAEELQACGPQATPPTITCQAALTGSGAGEFATQSGGYPTGLAVDNSAGPSHGDVFVLDIYNLRVEEFSPTGKFLLMIGGDVDKTSHANLCTAASGDQCGAGVSGTGPGEFETNAGDRAPIAVGPGGILYVGDGKRVQEFSEAGAFLGQIAVPMVAQHLAVDSTGDVYVKGQEAGGGIHKYEPFPSGSELGEPRDPNGDPGSIAVGLADQLIVLQQGVIDTYDSSGKQLLALLLEGEEGGSGIAFGESIGRFYVLGSSHVHLYSPPPSGPLFRAGATVAREVKKTGATVCATIDPEGMATTVHFQYITAAKYTQDGEQFAAGSEQTVESASIGEDFETHEACQTLTGLAFATAYRFRAIATNAASPPGGITGETALFETEPPVSIDATFATDVSATSAILGTEVNPLGEPATYHFEYDTIPYSEGEGPHGTSFPIPDASLGTGAASVTRSKQVDGLVPSTVYYYHVVATSVLGTIEGQDGSFTTQPALSGPPLLDGRAWEMVSPPQKSGASIQGIPYELAGGVLQASAGGEAIAYTANGAFGQEAGGARSFQDSQFLAFRGAHGWSTKDITTPREDVVGVIPGNTEGYRAFSSDLSLGLVQPRGFTPLSSLATETTPYLRGANGEFLPLIDPSDVPPGTVFDGPPGYTSGKGGLPENEPEIEGGSPDLHSVVIASCYKLTEDAVKSCGKADPSLYVWREGALQLASILPGNHPAALTEGAVLGGPRLILEGMKRHALSEDGTRLVFTTIHSGGGTGGLYLRDMVLGETIQLDLPEPGVAGGNSTPEYEDMSADGSKVFFTDTARLTINSKADASHRDLYMCEILVEGEKPRCALKDLSVAHGAGEAGAVLGVSIGADASGHYIYFVANGVLTSDAAPGDCTVSGGACGLYLYDTVAGTVRLVTTLSGADHNDWAGDSLQVATMTARVSPNGRFLAFMSQRSLTGYDNRDTVSGQPDQEVYLYDRLGNGGEGKLVCASCNPSGARPHGVDIASVAHSLLNEEAIWDQGGWLAAAIPGWTPDSFQQTLYQSRYLSDSGRLFFDSVDALVPRDSNGTVDVYEYEPPQSEDQPVSNNCTIASLTYSSSSSGCVDLVSTGTSPEESAFLDASESGDDVFFLTASQLVPADVDTANDIYDARVGGAVSEPAKPPACEGDACQNPVSAPDDPTPGSLTFQGPGNPGPSVSAAVKGKAKPSGRSLSLARALKACARKPKPKRATCEKQARRTYGPVGRAKKSNRGVHR